MIQQQLSSPISLCGRPIDALFGARVGGEDRMTDVLDNALPLHGANHADVIEYRVEIPMRYAEFVAIMPDGRKVGLLRPRQFVGWSSCESSKSLLFRSGTRHLEVVIEDRLNGRAPGAVREAHLESRSERHSRFARKFIGRDGDQVILPVLPEIVHA